MRLTIRAKLLAIAASTAIAFLVAIVASAVVAKNVEAQLRTVEQHHIPKLELGPQIEADFALLRRAYQDAVAAHDGEALERTRDVRDRILARIDQARDVLDPAASTAFREALVAYHDAALGVSRRMMANEGGEDVVDAIALMQGRHARAQELLQKVIAFDRRDLGDAFRAAREAQAAGANTRLAVMVSCLAIVLVLSLLLSRGVVRSLGALHTGFARFGKGSFDDPIHVAGRDEIADVATEANRMAESLARLASERERMDWIKSGIMELAKDLHGELDVEEVARRAARNLARYLDAPGAALYAFDAKGLTDKRLLRLVGHYALTPGTSAGEAAPTFEVGQGLVGEAARSTDLVVIADPPPGFVRLRSGLGDGAPCTIVLAPLVHDGEVTGVLELAFFKPFSEPKEGELLGAARETIAVALEVARSRAATRELLARTQEQAKLLLAQDEELRAANEELLQTNEELGDQAQELAAQRATLQAKNTDLQEVGRRLEQKAAELTTVSAYKSQFLANMSHELRTPLNSMLLLSKLLADNAEKNLTEKQIEYAKTVNVAGKDLLLLINQVLDLAKVEAGKQEVHVERVRLADLADRVRRAFAPVANDKGLCLIVEVEDDLPETIATDAQRVGQILNNLVANAIKFTEHGEVKLVIATPEPGVRFRVPLRPETAIAFIVSDTGPGIAPEHQERIFAPFEQVLDDHANPKKAHRRQGGTGLGLSISREFTSLLGGELALRSTPGEGSTFICYLPRERTEPATNARPIPPKPTAPSPVPGRPFELHLLVIEDDAVFAEVLGDIIRERGLVHLTAKDGRTGLRLARERRPRGIILDVKLPDIDGWRVMAELREDPTTASIPVHFVSALEMQDRGLAMGATGYLTKPAEREDLVRVVESLAPKLDRASHKVLVVDDDVTLGDTLVEQLAAEGLAAVRASSARAALDVLEREPFAALIVDPSVADMRELELLEALQRRAGAGMPAVVIYTSRPLSRSETARLETYAEAVVLKEGASTLRLMDEIRLFIRRLEAGLPRRTTTPKLRDDIRLDRKKLLVVDDDMRTVYALSATLRAKGADVLIAETGAVALSVLAQHPDVDAVLMDVMMPEMDGHEATRRIRQQPRFQRLPIVALTAKAMKGDEAKCIEAGATDYLPKPVDADALLSLLHARLFAIEKGG